MSTLNPGRSYLYNGNAESAQELLMGFAAFDQTVSDATELDVKSLRTVINQHQLAAANEARIWLLTNSEALSDVMQNTLLKLLEEPPTTLVVVIQTTQPGRLLPTILSRLQPLAVSGTSTPSSQSIFADRSGNLFDRLSKLNRDELISELSSELTTQRARLLDKPSLSSTERIDRLDRAINRLKANANVKLTLDWLLLHLESN